MSVAKCVRTGVAALGVLLTVNSTHAADLYYGGYKDAPPPPPPAFIPPPFWQGFYIGGHLGAAWSEIDAGENVVFACGCTYSSAGGVDNSGLFGGIQAGYNVQAANFLYGIELDFGAMDISGSDHSGSLAVSGSSGWYGDITARAGYTYGNALFYAKGGVAFFNGDVAVTDPYGGILQSSGNYTGWTIGAGIEYIINPRWSAKVEYMYFDFGNDNCNSSLGHFDNSLTVNTIKVGFNFLLHSPVGPLY